MNIKYPALKPEIFFLIIGLIFGVTIALINPMFQVPDEPTHYLKVMNLAQGHIFVEKSKVFVDMYSPIPYIVPTIAILLGKLSGLSPAIIFYLGRLANLFLYVSIIYFAIKYTPILKWVIILLALMPMALYEAASFSSDGFNIAISLLLISFILKLAFDDKIYKVNKNQLLYIFFLGALLALSKEIYILVLLLFLIIPKHKFVSKKYKYTWFSIIFLFTILIALLWTLIVNGIYVPISPQVYPQMQLIFILTHFITFTSILINTIVNNFVYYLTTFVGTFGWKDIGLDTPLSPILVYIYISFLFYIALTDKSEVNMNLKQRICSIMVFLISFVSIFVLEYLTWNNVGNNLIDGVYGRYFIPIALLLFLGVYNNRIPNFKGNKILVPCFIIIILIISVFMIYHRFY